MNRFKSWFSSLSRFHQIGLCAFIAHIAIILLLCINHLAAPRPELKKPIAIRTTLQPKAPQIKKGTGEVSKQSLSKKGGEESLAKPLSPPSMKGSSALKKEEKREKSSLKKAAVQTASSKNSQPSKRTSPELDLLKEIAEGLEALGSPQEKSLVKTQTELSLPSRIEIGSVEKTSSVNQPSYGAVIASMLQNGLDLPEFGEVVAQIEIEADGTVRSCEIVEMQSRKNGEFLKKRLQEFTFPCFNTYGLSENRMQFTITFRNAENR